MTVKIRAKAEMTDIGNPEVKISMEIVITETEAGTEVGIEAGDGHVNE